jgi:hypothetical protein
LHDEVHHRALSICIGQAEAFAIDQGLRQSPLPRPMTMNFIASILQALGAVLEEVRIETLKDDIDKPVVLSCGLLAAICRSGSGGSRCITRNRLVLS